MTNVAAYIAVFTFTLVSGQTVETEEETYSSREECLLNSEAEARSMERQWRWEEEKTGMPSFFKAVEVRCERR